MNVFYGSNLLDQENDPLYSTYRIDKDSLGNLNQKDLIKNTISNLDGLVSNKLTLNYNTAESSSFFTSRVSLFTDSAINTISSTSNNKINLHLVPRSPATFTA
ncbi:hypothetical protein IKS57_02675 [bacterium]|nr:hypothetical protein [bacterium]